MRIAATGRAGQVVSSLAERAPAAGAELILLGRPELDLEQPQGVRAAIAAARPDIVVSAAAYTAVDRAEDEPESAFAVNAAGAGAVAEAAAALGVPVIHISTDYVFAGDKASPYVETDPTGPRSVYGVSKLEGERLVAVANPAHVILRTAWVYSPFGRNFAKTMLELAKTRDTVRVVADQHGCPTSALDIADAVLAVSARLARDGAAAPFGIFHLAGRGEASWADFARAVFAASRTRGGPSARVEDIATADYPTKAVRPKNSRLDCVKLQQTYGLALPDWDTSCVQVVERLVL